MLALALKRAVGLKRGQSACLKWLGRILSHTRNSILNQFLLELAAHFCVF
jgi:hypothetical protein